MAVQAEVGIVGAMALAARFAVVVGATVAQGPVEAEDVVGALAEEGGVGLAVRADGAGAYVPPLFRSDRPVCWAEAATCCPRSRSRTSTERKISRSGASTRVSALCSRRGAAAAWSC